MFKSYSTFAGAQRAAQGKPIVRLLDDPREAWIVVDKLHTDVHVWTTGGGNGIQSRKYENAGSMSLFDIAAKDQPSKGAVHDRIAEQVELAKTYAEDGAFRTAANIYRKLADRIDLNCATNAPRLGMVAVVARRSACRVLRRGLNMTYSYKDALRAKGLSVSRLTTSFGRRRRTPRKAIAN